MSFLENVQLHVYYESDSLGLVRRKFAELFTRRNEKTFNGNREKIKESHWKRGVYTNFCKTF